MSRWAWVSLGVVLAAGAATVWYWHRLLAYTLSGLPPRPVDPGLLACSAIPTGLLAAAALLQRRSAPMQLPVGVAAVAVGALQVLAARAELAAEWTHGTGFLSFLALVAGTALAAAVFFAAAVATLQNAARRRKTLPAA